VPGFAPFPPQVSHRPKTGNSISFSVPRTASSKVMRRSYRRSEPAARARRSPAEERVEDVAERAEPGRIEPGAVGAEPRPAEHVVRLASLRVREDLVRLADLLEAFLGAGVRVDVGVPLLGEAAVGLLDLGVGRGPLDAEDDVVIEFGGHVRAEVYGRRAGRVDTINR